MNAGAHVLRDDAHSYTLTLTHAQAQALVDVATFGVAGGEGSRADLLREIAVVLSVLAGITRSRQDFTGLLMFDDPDELPGLTDPPA